MDDQNFQRLLKRFDLSWEGYRKVRKGVKKRVNRHMNQLGCRGLVDYFKIIDTDERIKQDCRRLLTVSISRFFRDRELWKLLESEILPAILKKPEKKIRIWSTGCACGEEVYSLKILLEVIKNRLDYSPEFEILATDLNPIYLQKAEEGIYSLSSLKDCPEEWLSLYFNPIGKDNGYKIIPILKRGIEFLEHDLLTSPPSGPFHLIFLRNNLLTYYQDSLRIPALKAIIGELAPEGFLIIGSHEAIPQIDSDLLPLRGGKYIFQKQKPSSQVN
jgi:chemotaxis methyl-accepting protein methylase